MTRQDVNKSMDALNAGIDHAVKQLNRSANIARACIDATKTVFGEHIAIGTTGSTIVLKTVHTRFEVLFSNNTDAVPLTKNATVSHINIEFNRYTPGGCMKHILILDIAGEQLNVVRRSHIQKDQFYIEDFWNQFLEYLDAYDVILVHDDLTF